MHAKVVERRLDLLRLEGNGLFPSEIVKELSVKYAVTERAVYYDFETRDVWQPVFQEMKKGILAVLNKHDQLYRRASLSYMQAESTRDKILALWLMRALNKDAFEFLQSPVNIVCEPEKVKSGVEVTSLLRKYESVIKKVADENIRAASAQELVDPAKTAFESV